LKVNPKYISDKYIYTIERSLEDEDDILLVRYGYELKRNSVGDGTGGH